VHDLVSEIRDLAVNRFLLRRFLASPAVSPNDLRMLAAKACRDMPRAYF
jgi:hypothetical protein